MFLEDFAPIGDGVSIRPARTSTSTASQRRDLAIMCSWMGANPKHIAKYTTGYAEQFPNATVVLVQTSLKDMMVKSVAQQRHRLLPVLEFIRSFTMSEDGTGEIWIHCFSNGGSYFTTQLAMLVEQDEQLAQTVRLRALIMDSTPCHDSYRMSINAMAVSLPTTFFLRMLGLLVIHLILTWSKIIGLFGEPSVIEELFRNLNRLTMIDPAKVPRLYLYSKADQMVNWKDVTEHAEIARKAKDAVVHSELFERSAHCNHLREDSQRYWKAVQSVLRQ